MLPERPAGLTDRLRARIEAHGPLTFAEFMEAALYDPENGFFDGPVVGEGGDFVTSPHLSPVFGMLVAAQVEEFWELLGRPDPFDVIEVGAGDGTLARQILESLSPAVRGMTRYTAVDRSLAARSGLGRAGVAVAEDLGKVPGPITGCILANELLDNLPFHRVRRTAEGLVELFVGWKDDGFVLEEGVVSDPKLTFDLPDLPVGAEWPVSPSALSLVDQARSVLSRGYVWIADYAARGQEGVWVHGYRRHRLEDDVLTGPGSRDITAGVDLEALTRHARTLGLSVWGPVPQGQALLALGFRDLDHRAQARQVDAISRRRGIDAIRIYSNRTRANLLLAHGGLGDFFVLCLGVGVDQAPRSVRMT
jgi:SAM-dependent MidA family methyltransferase